MKLDIEEILIKSEAIYMQLKNCKVSLEAKIKNLTSSL